MQEIGELYTEGNKELGIKKHRLPLFSDERRRAERRYDVSSQMKEDEQKEDTTSVRLLTE